MIPWVAPFLELKDSEETCVDSKVIVEFALHVSYCARHVHHQVENRAPCVIRSLFMHVITFSDMAKA